MINRFSRVSENVRVKEMIIEDDSAAVIANYDFIFSNGTAMNENVAGFWKVKAGKPDALTIFFDTHTFFGTRQNNTLMAYDEVLANRVRTALGPVKAIEEKKMFGGLAFMVRGKMCINISGDRLMCRFNPDLQNQVLAKTGVQPMIMKGKVLSGYCYVAASGFRKQQDFDGWIKLALDHNAQL